MNKEFLKLVAENPDLPIFGFVDSDVVADDSGRWLASFGKAYVGEIAATEERFFDDRESFKEDYYDSHDEELDERFHYSTWINEFTLEQGKCTAEQFAANKEAQKALDKYLDEVADKYFVKAILVNINTPDELYSGE